MKVFFNNDGTINKVESSTLIATSNNVNTIEAHGDFSSFDSATIALRRQDSFVLGEFSMVNEGSFYSYAFTSRDLAVAGQLQITIRLRASNRVQTLGMVTASVYYAIDGIINDEEVQTELDNLQNRVSDVESRTISLVNKLDEHIENDDRHVVKGERDIWFDKYTKAEIDEKLRTVSSPVNFRGSVETFNLLPTDNNAGDIWLVEDENIYYIWGDDGFTIFLDLSELLGELSLAEPANIIAYEEDGTPIFDDEGSSGLISAVDKAKIDKGLVRQQIEFLINNLTAEFQGKITRIEEVTDNLQNDLNNINEKVLPTIQENLENHNMAPNSHPDIRAIVEELARQEIKVEEYKYAGPNGGYTADLYRFSNIVIAIVSQANAANYSTNVVVPVRFRPPRNVRIITFYASTTGTIAINRTGNLTFNSGASVHNTDYTTIYRPDELDIETGNIGRSNGGLSTETIISLINEAIAAHDDSATSHAIIRQIITTSYQNSQAYSQELVNQHNNFLGSHPDIRGRIDSVEEQIKNMEIGGGEVNEDTVNELIDKHDSDDFAHYNLISPAFTRILALENKVDNLPAGTDGVDEDTVDRLIGDHNFSSVAHQDMRSSISANAANIANHDTELSQKVNGGYVATAVNNHDQNIEAHPYFLTKLNEVNTRIDNIDTGSSSGGGTQFFPIVQKTHSYGNLYFQVIPSDETHGMLNGVFFNTSTVSSTLDRTLSFDLSANDIKFQRTAVNTFMQTIQHIELTTNGNTGTINITIFRDTYPNRGLNFTAPVTIGSTTFSDIEVFDRDDEIKTMNDEFFKKQYIEKFILNYLKMPTTTLDDDDIKFINIMEEQKLWMKKSKN